MDARKPRVFIGIPCYGAAPAETLEDYMRFAYHLGRRLPQFDFFLGIRSKAEQFRARNQIVDAAIQMDCEWTLMLDDDMVIDSFGTDGMTHQGQIVGDDAYGFLERLIAHDKDICGVLYYEKGGACKPVAMVTHGEKGYRNLHDDEITHGLQPVDVAGGGCLLIKTKVFDHLRHPFFAPEFDYGTDVQLCREAAAKGFSVFIDSSIEFGHVKPSRSIVTSRNRHQFQLEDQVPGEVKHTFVSSALYEDLERDAAAFTGYHDLEEMTVYAQSFHHAWDAHKAAGGNDAEWYRRFPLERVARQVWFNTASPHKRQMTEFILNAINHASPLAILDFGCGIGIPSFFLASKGHAVTSVDIEGTGTLEFLRWRAERHGVELETFGSKGGVTNLGDRQFDIIIAMDVLEHFPTPFWKDVLAELVAHLTPGGILFCNNAVLDDPNHAEHYDLRPKDFQIAAAELNLIASNQIMYVKRADLPTPTRKELTHA